MADLVSFFSPSAGIDGLLFSPDLTPSLFYLCTLQRIVSFRGRLLFFSSAFDTKSSTSLSTATGLPTFSRLFFLADCIPLTNQPVFYASGSIFVLTFPLLVVVKLHNLDTSLFKAEFWDKCDVLFQDW